MSDSKNHLRGRLTIVVYALTAVVFGVFLTSTIPGVRPQPGYNLLLDGYLNNIAYGLSAVICIIRAKTTQYHISCLFLGLGLALYGSGNVFWTIAIRVQNPDQFPSIADALWLSFYPCAFIALILTAAGIVKGVPRGLWLSSLVCCLAVAAATIAAFAPLLATAGGTGVAVATTMAYPVLDALLLLFVVFMLLLFNWQPPGGLWFIGIGLTLFVVADGLYLSTAHNGTYQPGGPLDAVWVSSTLIIALAPGRVPTGAVLLPHWLRTVFPARESYRTPIAPFEVYVLFACVLSGFPVLLDVVPAPGGITALLSGGVAQVWAGGLSIGALITLCGIFWRGSLLDAASIEQFGLILVACSCAIYGVGIWTVAGAAGLIPFALIVSFGVSSLWRWHQLWRVIRRVEVSEADATQAAEAIVAGHEH